MISCGEPSGDLYAGALTRELLRLDPSALITGFGSQRLRSAGATLVDDFQGLSVTGLLEVARVLPRTYAIYRRLLAHAAATRPDVFVAIDFPDFNFRLAQAMRKLGVPVVYYISPQLWAWRPGRMKTMQRIADRVLVIFPFEEEIYRRAGVPVEWVGHPLLDVSAEVEPRSTFLRRPRPRPREARRCASSRKPDQRGERDPAGSGGRGPDHSRALAGRAVRARARAASVGRALRRSQCARPVDCDDCRRYRQRSRRRRRRARGVGHGDRAGGAPRVPDGRRLSTVSR